MTTLKLRKISKTNWAIFGPKGNQISGGYHATESDALEWAKAFASSWYNCKVELDKETTNE